MSTGSNAVQCTASAWRATPAATHPTPNSSFHPTQVNYYTSTVLDATWPAFIGLGVYIGLFLAYLLWRLVLLASRCQRCRAAKSVESTQGALLESTELGGALPPITPDQQNPEPTKFSDRPAIRPAWTLPALRKSVVVLAVGVLAGCIYGMVEIDSQLVGQGIATLDGVKSYIQDVVGAGDATVVAAGTINDALAVVSNIIGSGINATDITANMECMRPWLNNLPDPGPLRIELTGVSNLTAAMAPLLATVAGNFSALVHYDALQGTYLGSLPVLLQSQQQLQELQSQEAAFAGAAAALTLPFETPGTMAAARDALSNLLNNPSISSKAAMLDAAGSAVQSADAELGNADTDLQQALTLANQLLKGPASALNQTLTNQTAAYEAARPCMVALRARSQSINATIFRLPDALNADLSELQTTQSKLDAILGVENNSGTTGNVTTVSALDTGMTSAEQQLTIAQNADTQVAAARQTFNASSGGFSASSFVSALNATKTSLLVSQDPLTTLLASLNAYVNGDPTALPYSTLAPEVQSAGTSAGTAATSVQQLLTSAAPMYQQSQSVYSSLTTTDLTVTLGTLAVVLKGMPSATTLLVPVNDYAAQYAALPQPPTFMLDMAETEITSLANSISSSVVSARQSLGNAIDSGQQAITKVNVDGLGTINKYQAQYEPQVRYYDTIRQVVSYIIFGLTIVLCAMACVGVVYLWPAVLKLTTLLLMALYIVCFALVIALTAGIKVGTDGCANLEPQILGAITDSSITPVVQYYLYGNGTDIKTLLKQHMGLDVDGSMQQVISARNNLLAGVQNYTLLGSMAGAVALAVAGSDGVITGVDQVLQLVDYNHVHPVYLDAKSYGCCTVLDVVGGEWTALIIVGCFVFFISILSMILIGFFDQLYKQGYGRGYFSYYAKDAAVLEALGANGGVQRLTSEEERGEPPYAAENKAVRSTSHQPAVERSRPSTVSILADSRAASQVLASPPKGSSRSTTVQHEGIRGDFSAASNRESAPPGGGQR